jgi:pSer/pThr/pTyr-binding forkhead associated (FHA) protein
MKVSLVVAQGVHKGKVIPIPIAQFVIGRDEGCQLRPSSPAISKRHCAIVIRSGKIFVRDFGSTNGTFVNDQQVSGEIECNGDEKIRIGPLEFTLVVKRTPGLSPSRDELKPSAATVPTPAPNDSPTKEEQSVAKAKKASADDESERMAAMLLSTDDGPPGPLTEDNIPGGSTVFELQAAGGEGTPPAKQEEKKAGLAEGENSKKAAEILRKYMQRPRT